MASNLSVKSRQKLYSDLIYVSSVVEGVRLTKKEVEEIVKLGKKSPLLRKGRTNPDLLQAYGQKLALDALERWAKGKTPITINYILELHRMVFGQIDPFAGKYRQVYVRLRSSALMPSFPFIIGADMDDFNKWLIKYQRQLNKDNLDEIIHLIAKTYHQITKIHPFADGNGRTARLFVNLLLRRYGFPYIIIPKVDNFLEMREALRDADRGDNLPLEAFMKGFLEQATDRKIGITV